MAAVLHYMQVCWLAHTGPVDRVSVLLTVAANENTAADMMGLASIDGWPLKYVAAGSIMLWLLDPFCCGCWIHCIELVPLRLVP